MYEDTAVPCPLMPTTLSKELTERRQRLIAELADVERAQELLNKNPSLKELFDIVSRVKRF